MDELSAQAEADRPELGQARGWMRSLPGRVIPDPLADVVSTARLVSKVPPRAAAAPHAGATAEKRCKLG